MFKTLTAPVKTIFIVFLISHSNDYREFLFDCRFGGTTSNRSQSNQNHTDEVWFSGTAWQNSAVSLDGSGTAIWNDSNSLLIDGASYDRLNTTMDQNNFQGAHILSCTCSANTSTHFKVGAKYDWNSSPFRDGIMEVLCYDSALSTADISSITDYLNEKWGVYGTYESTPLKLTLGVPTPATSTNLIIHLDASNMHNFQNHYLTGQENGKAFDGMLIGKALNLRTTEEIRDVNKPATIWGFGLGGRSDLSSYNPDAWNKGLYIYPNDKFAFQIDYQHMLSRAPSKFEIYGCTSKDTDIDFSNVNNGRYEFLSSGNNFLKLASWDSKEIIKWDETDEEGYRINQYRSSIVRYYNESFTGGMFYWMIIVFYGVNSHTELSSNSTLSFRYFSSEIRSPNGERYKRSSNTNTTLEGVPLIDWPHYAGAMEEYGEYLMLREWITPQYYHLIDDPSNIRIEYANNGQVSYVSLWSTDRTTINLTSDLWQRNRWANWRGQELNKNYVFMLGLVDQKLVLSNDTDPDTGPLNQSEPKSIGNSCSIELLHSLLDTTDTTNSNGNELTNSSYVDGVYTADLNKSFTAQVYDYLYLIVYTTTYDGTTGYSKLSFANLDIQEESSLPAIGLDVINDINITDTLTNKSFNVTDSSTIDRNLTANKLSVSKNCNVGGNIVVTGNATFEDSLTIQGANTLIVEGSTVYENDLIILNNNKLKFGKTNNQSIHSNGSNLTLTASVDINLTAASDINIDTDKNLLFSNSLQKLVGDNVNNFNISSGKDINLTPSEGYNVNIPQNIGISFKNDTQQLISDK